MTWKKSDEKRYASRDGVLDTMKHVDGLEVPDDLAAVPAKNRPARANYDDFAPTPPTPRRASAPRNPTSPSSEHNSSGFGVHLTRVRPEG